MTGLFITLEGGDGAGKTTQAALLQAWLESEGRQVVRTREPGGTELGAEIRRLLLQHTETTHAAVSVRAEALLFAADRAQHVAQVVRPALAAGAVVVQDRYIDSSVAYQGAGRPLAPAEIRSLSEWATEELWPQLTVLLDIDPAIAAMRRDARGENADRLEGEASDFHQRVREHFRVIAEAEPDRVLVVDASLPQNEIHARIIARVREILNDEA